MKYDEIVSFHGHECPGLAIGYRMALAALAALGAATAGDEELVAIVENDACGMHPLQRRVTSAGRQSAVIPYFLQ